MSENDKKEKLLELLADQAIFGLSNEEKAELKSLSSEFPELANDFSLEEAAGAIAFSGVENVEQMPDSLRSVILNDSTNYVRPSPRAASTVDDLIDTATLQLSPTPVREVIETSKRPFWQPLGWAFAAMACIALIANVWLTRFQPVDIANNSSVTQSPTPEQSAAQKREEFLASATDVLKAPVSSPAEDKALSGEIVWSDKEQTGYMTFKGLPVNDQSKEAYQLWIFDETQDESTPVDGGVFNVDESGEVVIPIDAKLLVKNPKMFAVTVEKPGGVVVSKREKIVALGKVEA